VLIQIRDIYELTKKIKNTYDERNLVTLANKIGAPVEFKPLGLSRKSLKGFYTQFAQSKLITINRDLTRGEVEIVLPHEIGHVALKHKAVLPLMDHVLLNTANEMEISANYFSADYRIEDSDVLGLIGDGADFFAIASILRVYPELLAYKYNSLQVRGHGRLQCPIDIRARYLNECERALNVAEDFDNDPFED